MPKYTPFNNLVSVYFTQECNLTEDSDRQNNHFPYNLTPKLDKKVARVAPRGKAYQQLLELRRVERRVYFSTGGPNTYTVTDSKVVQQ